MNIKEINPSELSNVMRQYYDIKMEYYNEVVLFQLGDFFEMFFDDAKNVSRDLELTLTGKKAGLEKRIPMCGIPLSTLNDYLKKLLDLGYTMVVVEQVENGDLTKKLVSRQVTKIISKGTYINDSNDNNFVGAIEYTGVSYNLAYGDCSTGELYYLEAKTYLEVESEIINQNIRELVLVNNIEKTFLNILEKSAISLRALPVDKIDDASLHIKTINDAQKFLLLYLKYMQVGNIDQFKEFNKIDIESTMFLSAASQRQLELLKTIEENEYVGSLFWFLNKTSTAMGKRLLKKNIIHPLVDESKITARQNFIDEYIKNPLVLEETKDILSNIYDFERLIGRVIMGTINPKEVERLKISLSKIPYLFELTKDNIDYKEELGKDLDALSDLYLFLDKIIIDDAPTSKKEGNFIKDGFNEEIDNLRKIKQNSNKWLLEFETQEIEKTSIKNLKIKYNKIFGYFIEVTNSNLSLVPENYIRKQTMANCERYITQELKEEENKILNASDNLLSLEQEIYEEIKQEIKKYILRLQKLSLVIAKIDVFSSLAMVAINNNFVKPSFNNDDKVEIIDGRHPIVESMVKNYINNDVVMDSNNIVKIITGPNMAGKSTYMRMMATVILLAQIGSYVPATKANLKVFDGIFTRIGASDNLSKGKSTFMVEMLETNEALTHATKDSLLIFDELGRGTSTFDGVSLAKSIIDYIVKNIKAKTLFSTHYHELVGMDDEYEEVDLVHVKADDIDGEIKFHHKVLKGGSSRSYGIEVAKLAGINDIIVNNAKQIYAHISEDNNKLVSEVKVESKVDENQELFSLIKNIDVENLTPMQSMNILNQIKDVYEKKDK